MATVHTTGVPNDCARMHMEQVVSTSLARRGLALMMFGAFASVALILAVAGICGVLAGAVAERTRDIGVRSALGATPGGIPGMIVLQGMRLAVASIAIGLAGAASVGHFLRGLLYGVGATAPVTLRSVALLLAIVALAACVLPAFRALGVDPIMALRSDQSVVGDLGGRWSLVGGPWSVDGSP